MKSKVSQAMGSQAVGSQSTGSYAMGVPSCGVSSHMHGLLALAVKYAAHQRVGELPADARSAEAGSELFKLLYKSYGGYEARLHGSLTWVFLVCDETEAGPFETLRGAKLIVVTVCYFIHFCMF